MSIHNKDLESTSKRGKGTCFERYRRITGYLTSSTSTWNDGKKDELNDRVKHRTSFVDKEEIEDESVRV